MIYYFLRIQYFSILFYATTHTEESVYIISGATLGAPRSTSVIAQYKDDIWSIAGNLKRPRSDHGAIIVKGMTMIISGFADNVKT